MPLILRAGNGQTRSASSVIGRRVKPSGLSSSEAILASSLFGAIPIEHDSPVAPRTAFLSASRLACAQPAVVRAARPVRTMPVKSTKISSMPRSSISGAIAPTAALNRRE